MGVEDARSPSRMRGWARVILSGHPGRFQCVGIRCRRTVSTLNVSDTADTVRLRARRSLGILGDPRVDGFT